MLSRLKKVQSIRFAVLRRWRTSRCPSRPAAPTGRRGAKTNNVAELRGLQYLLRRAAKRPIGTKTKIATDSLYARNVTLGVWKFRRGQHASLIEEMRATLRSARRRHGLHGIHIDHVRSHTGMPGNELADEAAAVALERANTAPELQHALPPPPGIAWGEKALKDMGATTR